ncbi:putative hydrogenase [Trypanosoma theileri]|uniref:Putative hydrogenase n=1 Tax=Trypanosoma theileri TaxID=67003 RepID=A0A1X0P0T4_9TRYP|nr:putative hydrogenase [Trypanosoma theileri]ORC90451.1 putative hydrogenase [Trypanosoma theileri]
MSANDFSASLMLAGMDYIAPSEACTLPTTLQQSSDGSVRRYNSANEAVKITLQDCLACSGCVTTAEAILVSSQSREEILKVRNTDITRPFLVSISDQSASSIAAYLNIETHRVFHILSGFFRTILKVQYVIDLHWAQFISVEKTAEEYCRRMREERDRLPMIVSACPGWVCYCEKQGAAILPLLCSVMSPQGIAGSYAKRLHPQLCHISVQPCFDRKLEAARDASSENGERYTDFVLSTQEVLDWMLEIDSSLPWNEPLDSNFDPPTMLPLQESDRRMAAAMEGSGGYHRFAMRYAARELHHTELVPDNIHYEMKRNSNHQLATSSCNSGEVYCIAYGFQNIQNIVRGMKRKLASVASYTFIELMACPDGCLNGGGQVRHKNVVSTTETIARVRDAFGNYLFSQIQEKKFDTNSEEVHDIHHTNEEDKDQLCFSLTAFKEVEKNIGPSLWNCVFHDRQKEFEATLNNGGVHSLKW